MKRGGRLAFIVPRTGAQVSGGAEALCLSVARELMARYDIEILTTCALEYETWADYFPPGEDVVQGVSIRRFRVDKPRDTQTFDRLSRSLRYRISTLTTDEQEGWLREQGPYSTDLLRYLWENRSAYDAFVFFTYLYATTYFGLPLVADRAYLFPLAHDEWPIYMPVWSNFFARAQGFLYVSPEERQFVRRRFATCDTNGAICHVPVRIQAGDAERFRNERAIDEPFLLYVGRVDGSKGCIELCETFGAYRSRQSRVRNLVFAGPGSDKLPQARGVHALGYVDEQLKSDALAACDTFVMPSRFESLSIALLEAWAAGKPALVNGLSAPLVGQCRRSDGGLWYHDTRSFGAAVEALTPEIGGALGRQGQEFFRANYADGNVVSSFNNLLSANRRPADRASE